MPKNKLAKIVYDKHLIDYFYLNLPVEEVIEKMHSLKFEICKDNSCIPFNAQVKGYMSAVDNENAFWAIKEIDKKEIFLHRLFELVYYIDFELQTLSSPALLVKIDGVYYRATKIVANAMQISSYNYLEKPVITVVANDLINRWLYFDEDRNPNNYMIVQNSKKDFLVVAIDFNKSDLEAENMKITGDDKKFGWFRTEKTRFLTLLKPSNFENLYLEDFEYRLNLMMDLPKIKIKKICLKLFKNIVDNPQEKADLIVSNLINRREYINHYFRTWFKNKDKKTKDRENNEYSGLGNAFLKIYKNK